MKIVLTSLLAIAVFLGIFLFSRENNKFVEFQKDSPMIRIVDDKILDIEKEPYISPINIDYLRNKKIDDSAITIEEELPKGSNYKKYLASYRSEGYKIFGLLTVPDEEVLEKGFPAVVLNHGYIPPSQYKTTEGYAAYVDYLARNGFVVFKIDLRGNGNSEGISTGSYFSPAYTMDAIYALKALQSYENVDPERIGIWGHSMSGNLLLRAMLVSEEFKAGVVWAGAVYSYKDFSEYGISDNSYTPRTRTAEEEEKIEKERLSESSEEIRKLRSSPEEVDFENDFWKSISLTKNIRYLNSPIQIHHAVDDPVVNIGYSRDLAEALAENGKKYELIEHAGGGHNISSPYFEQAMQETVDFFKENL